MTGTLSAGAGFLAAKTFEAPGAGSAAAPAGPLIFATKWGNDESWNDFSRRAAEAGYDGFESWLPPPGAEREAMLAAAETHRLKTGFLVAGFENDPAQHFRTFEKNLREAVQYKPVYINCHSGRDFFSFAGNRPFVEVGIAVSEETGIPVYHETHRSRMLYAGPVARQFMEQLPGLRITLDISHWCNVHESLMEGQEDTVNMALQRTGHIHARVGHAEGPQVGDPRAPEWKDALEKHLSWWDEVVARKKQEGGAPLTILTEFGPPDYLPALPYTRQPVANQWDINVFMLKLLRRRYSS
jgi:sugar phosphate isomerase/epimerase